MCTRGSLTRFVPGCRLLAVSAALVLGGLGAVLIGLYIHQIQLGESVMDPRDYQMDGTLASVTDSIPADGVGEIVFSKAGSRRSEAARGGPLLDLRRVARRNLRYGGEVLVLPRRRRKRRPRPLALICDISGSMDRYTRLLLRFLHATTQGLEGVETYVFGTRLTRITHQLRTRDPDRALDEVARREDAVLTV